MRVVIFFRLSTISERAAHSRALAVLRPCFTLPASELEAGFQPSSVQLFTIQSFRGAHRCPSFTWTRHFDRSAFVMVKLLRVRIVWKRMGRTLIR